MKKSFYEWCIENNRQDLLNRWDYDLNNKNPEDVGCTSISNYFFKCPKGIHESTAYKLTNVSKYSYSEVKCSYCNSFAKFGIDNIDEHFLEKYWDYNKNNGIDPWKLPAAARKNIDIYIKCQSVEYHGSYKTTPDKFKKGYRCPYCAHNAVHPKESFAQWCVDNIDYDFINKYWSNKNTIDPYQLAYKSNKKVYIKCQDKDYHGSYLITPSDFTNGVRCSYCHMRKVHKNDSLGAKYPKSLSVWSDVNEDTPFEIAPKSDKKRWFKCENNIHGDYLSTISRANNRNFECPKCHQDSVDSYLQKKVDDYIYNNYQFVYNKEYDCSLICVNPDTGYILPYDRELIIDDKHLLLEIQGKQHYEICLLTKHDAKERGISTEESFELLKYRDNLKKEFALSNGYEFLEIPYYTSDNESYKTLIDQKISYILSINNTKLPSPQKEAI